MGWNTNRCHGASLNTVGGVIASKSPYIWDYRRSLRLAFNWPQLPNQTGLQALCVLKQHWTGLDYLSPAHRSDIKTQPLPVFQEGWPSCHQVLQQH